MAGAQLVWNLARATGFLAYLLLTASVLLGLVLSLKWRSSGWPRFISSELHEYLGLLSLLALGAHTLAIALDPFMGFTLAELVVPMASHYRPLWLAPGILGTYLVIGVWYSKRLRARIGYSWWRRLHLMTFVAFVLSTVHGLAMGSDSRTAWAGLIYAAAAVMVISLTAARLLTPTPPEPAHPWVALAGALLALWTLSWAVAGPLRPGWAAIANSGHGSGARTASPVQVASPTPGSGLP